MDFNSWSSLNDDAFSSWSSQNEILSFNSWWDELVSILINERSGAEANMKYWRSYYEDGYTPYGAFIEEECIDG